MPAVTLEIVSKREASLKSAVAALGDGADPDNRRRLKKRLRRAQRKRRALQVAEQRKQGKSAAAKED